MGTRTRAQNVHAKNAFKSYLFVFDIRHFAARELRVACSPFILARDYLHVRPARPAGFSDLPD
jgi:hypothetical protein